MRHIERWLGGVLMLLLLTACSSSSGDEVQPKEKPMLKILLFAPESPIVTRGSIGDVDALSKEERLIYSIDVWVFEHLSPDKKVGYIHQEGLSFDGQREISMEISDDFANLTNKPNVDIYVVANKESLAIGSSLGKETTMAALKDACIGSADFGLSSLVTPENFPATGLPMSGLLENQKVLGIPPVYTAKANNVRLVRAVSKIRFAFSKSAPPAVAPTISNISVSLKANMLPNNEYVFLEGRYPTYTSHMVTTGDEAYNQDPVTFFSGKGIDDIKGCDNPADYIFTTQTGQAYETLIQTGIDNDKLTGFGPFYLHESDKKLEGTISYYIGSATTPTVREFSMAAAGDFTRNHTWIVYGYFLGSGELKLNVVDVKNWDLDTENPKVYNW